MPESLSLGQEDAEQAPSSQTSPYQLGRNRAPRYRCGTCGSRNCSCVNLVESIAPAKRLARRTYAPAQDLVDMNELDHPQRELLSIQDKDKKFHQYIA